MEKRETCGPLFLIRLQKLENIFWSVLQYFSIKSGQSVGGIFDIADYIYS